MGVTFQCFAMIVPIADKNKKKVVTYATCKKTASYTRFKFHAINSIAVLGNKYKEILIY